MSKKKPLRVSRQTKEEKRILLEFLNYQTEQDQINKEKKSKE